MKRFTETTKWDDPWFLDLSPESKLLWLYLCDKCDNSGVVDLHNRKACFELGVSEVDHALDELSSRLTILHSGKIHIESFVSFQYGELKDSSNLHKSVIQLLKNHGLPNPSGTLQDGILMTPSKGKGKGIVKVNGKGEYTESFESLWMSYGLKGSKKVSFDRWNKLTEGEQNDAVRGVAPYLQETPDKQFRKDLERYLSQKVFEGVLEREAAGELNLPSATTKKEDMFAGVDMDAIFGGKE